MKKAFSLAEILIVMTVIGVIATLTMPQLIGGIDEAHYKAGIKKAYTTLTNIAAMEKADDNLPQTTVNKDGMINFFNALNNNLEVEGYAIPTEEGNIRKPGDIKMGVKWEGIQFGEADNSVDWSHNNHSPWIVTADGMAFKIYYEAGRTCEKKSKLNVASATYATCMEKSCLAIVVDVNGLTRGPNKSDEQRFDLTSTTKLKKLTGDQYSFYLASDGVAKCSAYNTIVGRILSGEK